MRGSVPKLSVSVAVSVDSEVFSPSGVGKSGEHAGLSVYFWA